MRTRTCIGVVVVVVLMGLFGLSTAHAQVSYPNLSLWLNQWFKVSFSFQELHFGDVGVPPDPGKQIEKANAYLVCTGLTPDPFNPSVSPVLSCFIHAPNEEGSWDSYPFEFNYVAGSASNFACWSVSSSDNLTNAFTVQIKGKEKKPGIFTGATVKTLGGYVWEIDDVQGSTERWVGSLQFSGAWVDTKTLCKKPKNSTLPPCAP